MPVIALALLLALVGDDVASPTAPDASSSDASPSDASPSDASPSGASSSGEASSDASSGEASSGEGADDAAPSDEGDDDAGDTRGKKTKGKKTKGKKTKGKKARRASDDVEVIEPGPPAEEPTRYLLELVVLGDSAPPAPSSVTGLLFGGHATFFWGGARLGALVPIGPGFVVGGDGGVAFSRSSQGNAQVGETWTRSLVEGRFLGGYRLTLGRAALTPYGYAAARLELGISNLTVLGVPNYAPVGGLGARVGAGVLMELGWVEMRFDCGPGLRTWGMDVACSMGVGARL